jgi:GT2 family glycosyltransferase/tetratricopeptide (TPR) repeat protein
MRGRMENKPVKLSLRRRKPDFIALANRARDARQWELASQLYEQALSRKPHNPPIWIQYGHALKESGGLRDPDKLARAEVAYRRAIASEPTVADSHLQLGHALVLQNKVDEAKAAYRHALALDPSLTDACENLVALEEAGARSSQSTQYLPADGSSTANGGDKALANPKRTRKEAHILANADRARDAWQWPLAAKLYGEYLNRNPQDAPIWIQYGHALKEAGDLAQAEMSYRRGLALGPAVADSHLQLGHALKLQGKTEEAQAAYLRAFVLDPLLAVSATELGGLGWDAASVAELKLMLAVPQEGEKGIELSTTDLSASAIPQTDRTTINGREAPDPSHHLATTQFCPDNIGSLIELIRRSGLFDEEYYREFLYGSPLDCDAIEHFLRIGALEGRDPNCMFSVRYYLERYEDVREGGTNPLVHFIEHGWKERRQPHSQFDLTAYLARYPDVVKLDVNPLQHFLEIGQKEGRNPGPFTYQDWCKRQDTLSGEDYNEIRRYLTEYLYRPLVTIILRSCGVSATLLNETISSIEAQLYERWELLIAPTQEESWVKSYILHRASRTTDKIRIVEQREDPKFDNNLNTALTAAKGEHIAFIGPGDTLSPTAIFLVIDELNRSRSANLIYADEDTIDAIGRRADPHFKSDWNPDLFYSYNYMGDFAVCRTTTVRDAGGLRPEFKSAEIYDLLLRVIEQSQAAQIRHLPFVVYHRRSESPAPEEDAQTARRALREHFERTGESEIKIVAATDKRFHRITRPVPQPRPLVSLIMPTGGGNVDLLRRAVAGILNETDYDNLELIILYNTPTRQEAFYFFEEIGSDPRVRIVNSHGGFNFPRIVNIGVAEARGDLVCLVNDDVGIIHGDWLDEMVGHALRPDVGVVGAMLYYPNDTIQHAGVILGLGDVDGVAAHVQRGLSRGDSGYFHRAALTQNLSCVTAACMVVRREVFLEVGGFDEKLVVDFNDVDFCVTVRNRGYLIVWTPYAELYHYEALSRGLPDTPKKQLRFARDLGYLREKWGSTIFDRDPYFNPNFLRWSMTYEITENPRIRKPWAKVAVSYESGELSAPHIDLDAASHAL